MWRPLRPDETDHELLWLLVSLGCAGLALVWLKLGLPHPPCSFHQLTGLACPTCGATRCVRYLARGGWTAAWLVNPLVFTTILATFCYDLYAATVLILRLPRLRFDQLPARTGTLLRAGCLTVLLANWAWLIRNGV
jgi:Protein of unknown function (DUF2752)